MLVLPQQGTSTISSQKKETHTSSISVNVLHAGCIASTASKALMIGIMNLISKVDWYDMEVSQVVALQTHKIRWPWKKSRVDSPPTYMATL